MGKKPAPQTEPELPPIPEDELRVFSNPQAEQAAELLLRATKSGHVHACVLLGVGPHNGMFRLAEVRNPSDIFALVTLLEDAKIKLLASLEE